MSNLIINQLIELFPTVSEDFLRGIYDGHKDEEVTIEELIDVILSFEFPPPRKSVNKQNLDTSNDSSNDWSFVELDSEAPPVVNNISKVNQPIENEVLQKSFPKVNDDLPSNCELSTNDDLFSESKETLMEKSCGVEQSHEVENITSKNLPDKVLFDQNKDDCWVDIPEISIELNSDKELDGKTKSASAMQCKEINQPVSETNNLTSSKNDWSNEDEEEEDGDSSPECSIRYLMREENGLERHRPNITDQMKEQGEVSGENVEFACNSKQTSHSSLPAPSVSSNLASSSDKDLVTKQKKVCQSRKGSICSNSSKWDSGRPHCSTKRMSLRSCKVKNEEERLRRRLINQNKLLNDNRQQKNTKSVLSSSQFLDIDSKYTLLCKVFTDANPSYLLSECEFLTDHEKVLGFISQNLELRDYPKIETCKKECRLMEKFHCTVAEFLEEIPDPTVVFSQSSYVRLGYEENAEIYLKARYQGLSDEEVKDQLKACSYNLTSACNQLEEEGRIPTPGVLDYTPLHHPTTIFFDQEVWYIEHRKEIQEYLDSAMEAFRIEEELNRPPPPPPPEEIFVCQICMDEIVEYKDLGTCEAPTGHLFCINCIKRSAEIRIGDGETTFPCLVNCGFFIPLQTVKELLPTNIFAKLMGRIQEDEVRKANIAGVETCPFCPYAYGPGEEAIFTCLNPECMKFSCRICRKEDHSPELCDMIKDEDEERARLIIEDRMAEALMRTCYSCGKNFVKSTGCNKMVCTCGAKMCYVCRQPVKDYEHFNGQGGDNIDRCPLFSNDNELHDQPVEATAQQVFNEIAANNPQLRLNRDKLIPK